MANILSTGDPNLAWWQAFVTQEKLIFSWQCDVYWRLKHPFTDTSSFRHLSRMDDVLHSKKHIVVHTAKSGKVRTGPENTEILSVVLQLKCGEKLTLMMT